MRRKSFLPILGTLHVRIRVSYLRSSSVYYGKSTSGNVLRDKNKLFNSAVKDAVVQHMIKIGVFNRKNPNYDLIGDFLDVGSLGFEIVDFFVDYSKSKQFLRIKRVRRRGRYYNYTFDRNTGRIVSITRFSIKRDVDVNL